MKSMNLGVQWVGITKLSNLQFQKTVCPKNIWSSMVAHVHFQQHFCSIISWQSRDSEIQIFLVLHQPWLCLAESQNKQTVSWFKFQESGNYMLNLSSMLNVFSSVFEKPLKDFPLNSPNGYTLKRSCMSLSSQLIKTPNKTLKFQEKYILQQSTGLNSKNLAFDAHHGATLWNH